MSYVKTDSSYKVQITASGGYSFGISKFYSDYSGEIRKNKIALSFRAQWLTEYILSVGIESGYLGIANLKTQDINADLDAYPLLLFFSYGLKPVSINTGIGYYYINSIILDNTGESKSNSFEFGYMASVQYNYQLTKKLGIGAEAKFYNIAESSKSLITFMANINYVLFEW
jgi:hypothetical protein